MKADAAGISFHFFLGKVMIGNFSLLFGCNRMP